MLWIVTMLVQLVVRQSQKDLATWNKHATCVVTFASIPSGEYSTFAHIHLWDDRTGANTDIRFSQTQLERSDHITLANVSFIVTPASIHFDKYCSRTNPWGMVPEPIL